MIQMKRKVCTRRLYMKGNIYWYDMQFSNYMCTKIVNKKDDDYEVYEYKIGKDHIHVIHQMCNYRRMSKIEGKKTLVMDGFRDAFITLFDAPKFSYIEFDNMDIERSMNTKIVIDRTG